MTDINEQKNPLLMILLEKLFSIEKIQKELNKIEATFKIVDKIQQEYRGDLAYMTGLLIDRKTQIESSLKKNTLSSMELLKLDYSIIYKQVIYIIYSSFYRRWIGNDQAYISDMIIECNKLHDNVLLNFMYIKNTRCVKRCEGWVGEDKPSSCTCGKMSDCNWRYSIIPHIDFETNDCFGKLYYDVN
jgi:hypothetical protein